MPLPNLDALLPDENLSLFADDDSEVDPVYIERVTMHNLILTE